eukprot:7688678-Alexandrium_andersonii.AAC.1
MSASLVGSEMCIRDSGWGAGQPALGAPPRVGAPDRVRGPPPAWEGMEPVSYTHLTLPTICSV